SIARPSAISEPSPPNAPKFRRTPNASPPRRLAPPSDEEARRALAAVVDAPGPYVLTVGQGTPYKNHYNAVRGFLRAFGGRAEYRMILVRRDEEPDRALARLLQTPAARAQVRVLAHVAPDVLNALYRTARIVLHPSY